VKAKELIELSVEELAQREKDLRGKHFNLKIQRATNQLANTSEIVHMRKDIARINTILNQKKRSVTK
jgi:large subunit ribosomal protein L29